MSSEKKKVKGKVSVLIIWMHITGNLTQGALTLSG